ncbi:unnamed protein product [Peronospora farinosa]|nr:unnamed protein product [Peronospora farinosa]
MSFNAAHFNIAFKGFRAKLHGHNYRLAVIVTGRVGSDGYVVDFGEIKKISQVICKDLNELFLVPMNSDVLKNSLTTRMYTLSRKTWRGSASPKGLLTTSDSSHVSDRVIDAFTRNVLLERGVQKMKISLSEADQHFASLERIIAPKS